MSTAVPLAEVAIHLRPTDNVALACRPIAAGTLLAANGTTVELAGRVPPGHKFAVSPIPKGESVRKYGQIIGFAGEDIAPGSHVHTHNVRVEVFERDYAFSTEVPPPMPVPTEPRSFQGYERDGGKFGTRNYVAIISTVNCSASTSKYVAEKIRESGILAKYPNVDGIIPITHKAGCAMAYDSEDHHQLNRTLAGFARHPNIGAYVLIGLGCETGQAAHLIETQGLELVQLGGVRSEPILLGIQQCGGIAKTVEAGVKAVADLLPKVNEYKRVPMPAERLILGTQCGGSDGNSGVTANPALGVTSDLIVQHGGTAVLAEMTEIYGAEHLLTRRAVNEEVGKKLVDRIKWWEWYAGVFGVQINNNPSVGNKEGGLTTIYEKSLGAVAKGGTTALVDVLRYAEPITKPGFIVMDTPGYDPVSMTGLVAGGANVLVFTTGRGSVFGCKPVPSLKVATNTALYEHMNDDMDINAGKILDGKATVAEVGQEIFDKILAVASGEKTKSELAGVGEEEFAPWAIGPTL